MSGYSWISVISLFCYLFLFMTFLAVKKEQKVIYTFMALLVVLILWSGGSFAMRAQLWPSVNFWHYVSVCGIMLLPVMFYHFTLDFLEEKRGYGRVIWLVVFVAMLVFNQFTDLLIPTPKVVAQNGHLEFIYEYGWQVYIVFAMVILCMGQMVFLIYRHSKGDPVVFHQLLPIILGVVALIAGHALATLPVFLGFPLDILSGVINACLLFYALYQKRLFQMTMLISRPNCFIMALIAGVVISYRFVLPLQAFLTQKAGLQHTHAMILMAMALMMVIGLLYLLIASFFNTLFVRSGQQQSELMAAFSQEITRLLLVGDILQKLSDVIQEAVGSQRIFVLIRSGEMYKIVYTASPLEEKNFTFSQDHPLVTYFKEHTGCILYREFARTTVYRGMWESEKRLFASLELECFCPLVCENELLGLMLLSKKKDHVAYHVGDLNFLQSISTICAIALKNSCLYEKALDEARRDELTGLISRKYFYELLDREFDKAGNSALSLCVLNIDDFKLYNQLYGTNEGDLALKRVGEILTASVGENGYASRINGKEFALILPGYDTYSAKMLSENIARQIGEINSRENRIGSRLTVSIGICAAPYMASNARELLKNADAAVYSVKRSGKNGILMYSEESYGQAMERTRHQSGYNEHASTIYALTAAIDTKDHYTFQHSQNVAYYAGELAKAAGLDASLVEIAKEAALLHDIGKIGVREDILNKTGSLTPEEYEIMKSHVDNAANIIRYLPSLDYVIPGVLSHHERYDGLGYPRKLAGEEIPVIGRILCVADAFDAMTSFRAYKKPVPVERAVEILKEESGQQFDPNLAGIFVQLVEDGKIELQAKTAAEIFSNTQTNSEEVHTA